MSAHFSFAIETVVSMAHAIAMGPAVSRWVQIGFPSGPVEWWASVVAIAFVVAGFGWWFRLDAPHLGDKGCVGFEKLLDLFGEVLVCDC